MGESRPLTVVSPDDQNGVELLPAPEVQQEFERLKRLGVRFTPTPSPMGDVTIAVFDDTSGNLIQIDSTQ